MARQERETQYLSTVKNALRILNSFSMEQPELRVSDLAASLGLNKSAVSRLLSTLASEGYVVKDPETQKYRLGLRILTLNSIVTSNLEINREARPVLRKLVQEIGEAAHIAVLEGNEVVYLEQVESQHHVRILSYVGRRNPVHCTSSGKVMLAFQHPDFIENFLKQKLERYTSATVTDPEVLRRQLAEIRATDYCSSVGEYLPDVVSFASPVRNYTKKVVAAVSVIGPRHRIKPQQYPVIKNKVIKSAREISRNLGYYHA